MRNSEKRYLTGEFARQFGIKKDTLLYYDKIGLFRPAGVSQNGYRYYTAAQGAAFWALHALRQMKVPIEDLRGYFASPSPEALGLLAGAQLCTVRQEMAQLARMQWLLEQIESATREGLAAPIDTALVRRELAQRLFCSARIPGADDTSAHEWSLQYDAFLAQLGLRGSAYIGSVIAQADLAAGRFARVDRLFVRDDAGLFCTRGAADGGTGNSAACAPAAQSFSATLATASAVSPARPSAQADAPPSCAEGRARRKKAAAQQRDGKPRVAVRPAGRYAVYYCKGSYEQVQQHYPALLSQLAQKGLRACGDAYEEYLIYELATADPAQYVTKISVAVEDA